MSHTPGPWRVGNTNGCKSIQAKGVGRVRQYWSDLACTVGLCASDAHEAEDLANAKLMAAAPELLAALEALLDVSPCKNGCKKTDMSCASSRAERAIRKATR